MSKALKKYKKKLKSFFTMRPKKKDSIRLYI